MRRLLIALAFAVGLAIYAAGPVAAASPNVGQHIHVRVYNEPVSGSPIPKGVYTFRVDITEHENAGAISYLRVDIDGGTTIAKMAVSLGPCDDCKTPVFDFPINFTSTGRHELRWHAEEPDTGAANLHKRQFTTSRMQVCVVTCTPTYRKGDWIGGGSWYGDYAVPVITSPQSAIVAGGSITAKSQYAGKQTCGFLNPDFHNDSHGTALGCWTGTSNHTLSLAGADTGDKLVVVTIGTTGQQAGVIRVIVGDNGSTADYETQSWWAQDGIVLP